MIPRSENILFYSFLNNFTKNTIKFLNRQANFGREKEIPIKTIRISNKSHKKMKTCKEKHKRKGEKYVYEGVKNEEQ